MQFKHPEILFALFLLIIPIVVHLFQLRRFQKVPFTNVQFLKEVELQTRKSATLKKWLILFTRLLLFTALIFAFAQPYLANSKQQKPTQTHIYLDNSFSMQAQGESGELFKRALQDIIAEGDESTNFNLFTNDGTYLDLNGKDLKNTLLNLQYSPKSIDLSSVLIKMKNDKSKKENIFIISDFQAPIEGPLAIDSLDNYFISQLRPKNTSNVSLDSLYITNQNNETISLTIVLKNDKATVKDLSISLLNNKNMLVGKSTVTFSEPIQTATFDIPNNHEFIGKFQIEDRSLPFDNQLYFTIQKPKKIKVTAIGDKNNFLKKIYTEDEFEFTSTPLASLDYNRLSDQHLIVLNEIDPTESLKSALISFVNKGGDLVVIPPINADLGHYNALFNGLNLGQIEGLYKSPLSITTIHFGHPLLKGVFEKEVQNFQYPSASTTYKSKLNNASTVISFENGFPLISQVRQHPGKVYWISAPLSSANSNFINSPLVVPVFYNFGIFSHQPSALYYTIGTPNSIDINITLEKDQVIHLVNEQEDFIPLQQIFKQKVNITTENDPKQSGFINVVANGQQLKTLAYNYSREESNLHFVDASTLFGEGEHIFYESNVKNSFNTLSEKYETSDLWKLFVGLTLLFLLIEILLLKSKV
ncbi:BatA domain-containing protein [Flavobacteriaceae bacterium F08102]|nr:BatA domain-containing protein [Flavobacteriaceae bacterium F08102]